MQAAAILARRERASGATRAVLGEPRRAEAARSDDHRARSSLRLHVSGQRANGDRRRAVPTLVDNPAEYADRKVKLVAIVPGNGAKSFLPFPPACPSTARVPDWMEVMGHIAMRLTWVDLGFSMDVFAHDAPMEDIKASARDADVFVCVDIQDKVLASRSGLGTLRGGNRRRARMLRCLEAETRVVYQPVTQLRRMEAKLVPWGQANKDLRLMEQVTGLFDRKNHLDLLFLHLLLVDASGVRVPAVDINQDLNLGNVWCIASNCKQLLECYKNDRCKLSLDCIDACGLNDQVCTYTCIRSYQNDQFQLLARCMLHKHNCLGNDAVRPELPEVLPMTHFRGEPLTHDVAEAIMQGHYGEGEGKNRTAGSLSPARTPHDHFPCQYQIWYRG